MIKYVIKRGGNTEDFTPTKINKWGEWGSKTLGNLVDWPSAVLRAVSTLPETVSSQDLQLHLIKTLLEEGTWSSNRFAGRLYAAYIHKKLYGEKFPTVRKLHAKLVELGFMRKLDYNKHEYAEIESYIKHNRDFKSAHFELHHVREKYALRNRITGEEVESQQFTYMRMAMALAEDQPLHRRLVDVKKWYDHFSLKRINAPTPNYVNLGTPLRGLASCCLYTTEDDAKSLAIGDHISYMMTCMSAGIGAHVNTRSVGDPVRGGIIKHQGRLPYYRSLQGAIKANLQNGRGGAATAYYSCFDPEVETIAQLKNPMSPEDKKIRGLDYNMTANKFFVRKALRDEQIFTFNSFTAPELWKAFYSDNAEEFERLYNEHEANPDFKKNYISAHEVALVVLTEAFETGRAYLSWSDELNHHTPFIDSIFSSNLCAEIGVPTKGYTDMRHLYSDVEVGDMAFRTTCGRTIGMPNKNPVRFKDGSTATAYNLYEGDVIALDDYIVEDDAEFVTIAEITHKEQQPEIGLCSLGAIVITNVKSDEEYADAMYYTLLMIDKCIHQAEYVLPHLGLTAKARMSAGVGIVGLAHYMAKKKLKYSSLDGKEELHRVAERHMYIAIEQSLRLGKELGNAPWIKRTKWPKGWLPIDTYNRFVDDIVEPEYKYDWEDLRARVIENGGIRNSVLVAYMPAEASSKASGSTNGIYPVRDLTLLKSDNNIITNWAAPEGDKLGEWYEIAWDIPTRDMIDVYAIFQKFTDQGISADLYRRVIGDDTVTSTEMLSDFGYMTKVGLKSRYYQNVKISSGGYLESCSDSAVTSGGGFVPGLNEPMVASDAYDGPIHDAWAAADAPAVDSDDDKYNTVEEAGCPGGFCSL